VITQAKILQPEIKAPKRINPVRNSTKLRKPGNPLAEEATRDKVIMKPSIDKEAIAIASIIRRTLLAFFISALRANAYLCSSHAPLDCWIASIFVLTPKQVYKIKMP
jgi:hypothetical protein